ncbi:unnamed protein product, partial [Symbiodinium necroappetens]
MRRKKREALRAELLAAGDPILSWRACMRQARSRPIPSASSSAQQPAKSKHTGRQETVKRPMRRKRRRLRAKPTVGLESVAAT